MWIADFVDQSRASRQILQGKSGVPAAAGEAFRGRIFLGCDNHPVTFQVRGSVGRCVGWWLSALALNHAVHMWVYTLALYHAVRV